MHVPARATAQQMAESAMEIKPTSQPVVHAFTGGREVQVLLLTSEIAPEI